MDHSNCKGCIEDEEIPRYLNKNEKTFCKSRLKPTHLDKNNETVECPCVNCLIKGICVVPCEKLFTYGRSFDISLRLKNQVKEYRNGI